MTDKELADKIVALGVGALLPTINKHGVHVRSYSWYEINGDELMTGSIDSSAFCFVRDWRVTGALMEKEELVSVRYWMTDIGVWHVEHDYMPPDGKIFVSESLPRAICEACVDALTQLVTDVDKDKTQDISK